MNENWDDPTESIMGAFDEHSLEIDVDFGSLPPTKSADELSSEGVIRELWPDADPSSSAPDLVLFDPMGFRLQRQLADFGYRVREAQSGVDVMTLVAAHPTGAVVCGPAEDAERRRLLTAAIRLRFPEVPVVYISTHARNPAAVRGAKAEGADSVLPLPLPAREVTVAELAAYAKPVEPQVLPDPVARDDDVPRMTDDVSPETVSITAEQLEQQKQNWAQTFDGLTPSVVRAASGFDGVTPSGPVPQAELPQSRVDTANVRLPAQRSPPQARGQGQNGQVGNGAAPTSARPPPLPDDEAAQFEEEVPTELVTTGQVQDIHRQMDIELDDELRLPDPMADTAAPGFPAPPKTDPSPPTTVQQGKAGLSSSSELQGEIGDLLQAISPFLWGLEDAARWVEELSSDDARAATHARTLNLLAKLLSQLKDRVDDLGL